MQGTSGHRDAVNGNGDRICTPVHDGDRCSDGLGALSLDVLRVPQTACGQVGGLLSTVFMLSEALIGATLVNFGLVAHDASPARSAVLSLHFVNTLTFLACLTLTAWWAGGRPRIRIERSAWVSVAAVTLLAISGALAALAITLVRQQNGQSLWIRH